MRLWIACATLAGLLLRVLWPELRPIHHDEAVNWYIAGRIMRDGFYTYDPLNYHGPLFHYAAALGRVFGGDHLAALRIPTMLAGAAMIPLAAGLRGLLGRGGAIAAAWTIALSPTLLYFARDAIHETWLGLFTLSALASAVAWWSAAPERRRRWAVAFGASVGGMLVTKETAVLTFAAWGCALAAAGLAASRNRQAAGPDGIISEIRTSLLPALAGAAVVLIGFFTALGRDPAGIVHFVEAYFAWGSRGIEGGGHAHSWNLHLRWLAESEPGWLAAGIVAAVAGLRARRAVDIGLTVWTGALLAAYSAIPYKTPWCLLQVAVPLSLLAARFLARAFRPRTGGAGPRKPGRAAAFAGAAAAVAVVVSAARAVDFAFLRYDDHRVPLVYVQTHREVEDGVDAMKRALARAGGDARVRQVHPVRYPFNWYLRGTSLNRTELPGRLEDPVLLSAASQELAVRDRIAEPYLKRRFRFRQGAFFDVWVRAEDDPPLLEPGERSGPGTDGEWITVHPVPGRSDVPDPPGDPVPGWRVRFFEGRVPAGEPYLTESRPEARVFWRNDHEKPRFGPNYMIWDGWLRVARAGFHGFALTSDDGSRLWVNGEIVASAWGDGETGTLQGSGTVDLAPGLHALRLEWYELGGVARLALDWTPPGGSAQPIPAERIVHAASSVSGDPR